MQGLAVAWFRREDWERWRKIDPQFEASHDYWLGRATAAFEELKSTVPYIEKVTIDPDEFLAWSAINAGGKVDSGTRATYATFAMLSKSDTTN